MSTLQQIINSGEINGYSEDAAIRKSNFHKEAKAVLLKIAKSLGMERTDYNIRSNMSGAAGSGEITLHTTTFYVQVSEPTFGLNAVMYRTCEGLKDYRGGQNQWAEANALYDGTLEAKLKNMM